LIVFFTGIFIVLVIILWLYDTGRFNLDLVQESQLITLTKLQPNKITINITQNEQASRIIHTVFSKETNAVAVLKGFDLLNKNNNKTILVTNSEGLPSKENFFNVLVNSENNPGLKAGTFVGFVQIKYFDGKDNRVDLVDIELRIKAAALKNVSASQ
jgi:hypothetical protein